jgi:hypothetical protein
VIAVNNVLYPPAKPAEETAMMFGLRKKHSPMAKFAALTACDRNGVGSILRRH